jgi:tripartite ATP-independent transporter DctP family solute receptor
MMSKKLIFMMITVVLVLGTVLTACGGASSTSGGTSPAAGAATASGNGTKPDKVVELNFGHTINTDSHYQQVAVKFAELVAQKSNGSIKVNVFPASQLGGEVKMIQAARSGSQALLITGQAPLVNTIKEYSIFDLPYLFDDLDQANKVLSGPVGKKYLDMLDQHGLIGLGFMSAIERDTFSKKPLNKVEDFKGFKVRVIQSPGYVKTYEALGGAPTPMAYSEVYLSVQQGVIDGGELSADQYVMDKFVDISKYFNRTKVQFLPALIIVSKSIFEGLSPEQQKAIREAGTEAAKADHEYYKQTLEDSLDKARKAGATIVEPDLAPFKEATKKVYEPLLKDIPNGKQLLDEIEAEKKK